MGSTPSARATKSVYARGMGRPQRGELNANATLTRPEVRQIRRLCRQEFTNVAIAEIFGVTHYMVSLIRLGKAWGYKVPTSRPYASIRHPERVRTGRFDMPAQAEP